MRKRTTAPVSRHNALIRQFAERGFKKESFREEMARALVGVACRYDKCFCAREQVDGERDCAWREAMDGLREACPRIFDGYRIDAERNHLDVLEVEIAHPLSAAKIEHIIGLVGELDLHDEWSLDVIVVNRHGGETRIPWTKLEAAYAK
jgi:hypothetical protein